MVLFDNGQGDLHQSWTIFILLWWATMMIGFGWTQGGTKNQKKIYELWTKRYFNGGFIRDAPPHSGVGYLTIPMLTNEKR